MEALKGEAVLNFNKADDVRVYVIDDAGGVKDGDLSEVAWVKINRAQPLGGAFGLLVLAADVVDAGVAPDLLLRSSTRAWSKTGLRRACSSSLTYPSSTRERAALSAKTFGREKRFSQLKVATRIGVGTGLTPFGEPKATLRPLVSSRERKIPRSP